MKGDATGPSWILTYLLYCTADTPAYLDRVVGKLTTVEHPYRKIREDRKNTALQHSDAISDMNKNYFKQSAHTVTQLM